MNEPVHSATKRGAAVAKRKTGGPAARTPTRTNDPARIARMQDALRVTLDRQTWFELYSLANGVEVP